MIWGPSTKLLNQHSEETTTLKELLSGKTAVEGDFVLDTRGSFCNTEVGLIEVEEMAYRVRIHHDNRTLDVTNNNIEKAIMEDMLENTSCYLNDDLSITRFEQIQQDGQRN